MEALFSKIFRTEVSLDNKRFLLIAIIFSLFVSSCSSLVKKLPQTLPQAPVKSGDILIHLSEIEYFMETLERLAPKYSLTIREVSELRDINLILQGWCYHNDRKAVLSKVNESLKLTVSIDDPAENNEAILELKFIGYALHDSVTFQPLKMELLIQAVVLDKSSCESSEAARVFISQNAELKRL
jgi:hypothetical protein